MSLKRRRRAAYRRGAVRYAAPFYAGRHPFQLFLLALSFNAGVPLVLSLGMNTGTAAATPALSAFIWGLMLVGGSVTALVGTYWPADVVTRLTLERIGLSAVGYGALLYGSISAIETPEVSNLLSVLVLLFFAAVCLVRGDDIATEIKLWVARVQAGK